MEIIEFFLYMLKTILHILEISVDLLLSKHKLINAVFAFILGGCLVYFLKIDSFSNSAIFPLVLFVISGIYLSYIITRWLMDRIKSQ